MDAVRHVSRPVVFCAAIAGLSFGSPLLAGSTLVQLPGTAGCISETGTAGACADGKALQTARSVALSPDGKNVYVGSLDSDAIAVFDRDAATGALTQKAGTAGCVSELGGGECTDGVALAGTAVVVVSPTAATCMPPRSRAPPSPCSIVIWRPAA